MASYASNAGAAAAPAGSISAGRATVKAVPTGDTVVLMGIATNGPPPELQLSFSDCAAPRLARGAGAPDEPHAWEAREFLRKLALGKTVTFRHERNAGATARAFGNVWFDGADGGPGESLAAACARAGWCVSSKEASEDVAAAAADALAANRGVHGGAGLVRDVTWSGVDAAALVESYRGRLCTAIVDYVSNGSNLRVLIVPEMVMLNMGLAGVRAARVAKAAKADGSGEAVAGEAFAAEAKHFVETRLLHRSVDLALVGVDKNGNSALGTVVHAAGNISVELLKAGLAKIVEPACSTLCGDQASAMRAGELHAKTHRLRLWREYVAPKVAGSIDGVDAETFEAIVVEALSGDQLSVCRASKPDEELRVSLSGIKAPRIANAKAQRAGEPWADESRDALRKICVGHKCRVRVEYVRDLAPQASEGAEKSTNMRAFASVALASPDAKKVVDVAERLVSEGLALVNPPRSSEERPARYDDLVAAEKIAKTKKLKMHSEKGGPAPGPRLVDLTSDMKKAKAFLPGLQRARQLKGFVEAVFSGSRVKLRIPVSANEHCVVIFALSACRAPGAASLQRATADAGGEAAKAFLRRTVLQRDVDVTIDDMDRNGVGLGSIRIEGSKTDLESDLLQRGFARLDSRHANRGDWVKLEAAAREARLGLWADAAAVAEYESANAVAVAADEKKYSAKLAEIVDGAHFYVHDNPKALETILAQMALYAPAPAAPEAAQFRRHTTCACLFNDGSGESYYRAKILDVAKAAAGPPTFRVRYVDYGNAEADVPLKRLRALPAGLANAAPAAMECELAYLHVAGVDDEDGHDAAQLLHQLAWGQALTVCEHSGPNAKPMAGGKGWGAPRASAPTSARRVVLLREADGAGAVSINEQLVAEGLARLPKTAAGDAAACTAGEGVLHKLKLAQQTARSRRAGVWRYGDADFSDDEKM